MSDQEQRLFRIPISGLEVIAANALLLAAGVAVITFIAQLVSLAHYFESASGILVYELWLTRADHYSCTTSEGWVWEEKSGLLVYGFAQIALGVVVAVLALPIRSALLLPDRLWATDRMDLWTVLCLAAAFFFVVSGLLTVFLANGIEADYQEFRNSVDPEWRFEIGHHIHYSSSMPHDDLRYIANSIGYTLLVAGVVVIGMVLWELGRVAKLAAIASLVVSIPLFLVWPAALRQLFATYEVWEELCSGNSMIWNPLTVLYRSADLSMALWFLLIAMCIYSGLLRLRSDQT